MKKELLTVKELAAELRMSVKSIQRAYRTGEIPVQWLRRMARFNLAKVQRVMERNGRSRMRRLNGNSTPRRAIGGGSRRRAQQKRPRLVTRGQHGGACIAGEQEGCSWKPGPAQVVSPLKPTRGAVKSSSNTSKTRL